METTLEYITKHGQLSLCTLYNLVIRVLYHDLTFDSTHSSRLVRCFRVLKFNQGYALVVAD